MTMTSSMSFPDVRVWQDGSENARERAHKRFQIPVVINAMPLFVKYEGAAAGVGRSLL